MALKNLRQFHHFDFAAFTQGKTFAVTGISRWKDYDTKQDCGTKVEAVITEDRTRYEPRKDGGPVSNLYEKLVFKVGKDINIPIGTVVEPVGVVAKVYGEYQNQLSIHASDIKVVRPAGSAPAGSVPTGSAPSPASAGSGKSLG